MITSSGYKVIGFTKNEFVAKSQFLCMFDKSKLLQNKVLKWNLPILSFVVKPNKF